MSTHHEIGHEQEILPGQAVIPGQPLPPSSRPPTRRRLLVALVTIIIIVLLMAMSAGIVALARLNQPHITPTPGPSATTAVTPTLVPTSTAQPTETPLPPGQWVQVLTDYRVTQLVAAPSQPNVVYACAIAPGVPIEYRSVETVLRSADFGATWQDIGKRAQMSRGCELAVNPTDSYEIVVATSSNPPADETVPSYVLEHTTNGGDTWETIHPMVEVPGLNTAVAWQGMSLRFAGNRLWSLQAISTSLTPTPQGLQVAGRVITSMDGGHTWTVLDTRLAASGRSAEAYAVARAQPAVVYELAYVPVVPGTAPPPLELYQSVDGGKSWQPVLTRIPWLAPLTPATILIGSENPDVVYLTNTRCPAAQAVRAGGEALLLPLAGSPYSVCMSSDAGKNWSTVSAPSQFAQMMGGGVADQQGRLYTQATMSGSTEIWSYDPAALVWSKVTQAPRLGTVLAGTPTGANGTTALWLVSTSGQAALYRYAISALSG